MIYAHLMQALTANPFACSLQFIFLLEGKSFIRLAANDAARVDAIIFFADDFLPEYFEAFEGAGKAHLYLAVHVKKAQPFGRIEIIGNQTPHLGSNK